MEEPAEGGSAFGPVDAAPPLSSSDWVLVPRELVLQVASVFVDFRDYADTCFRRLIDILGGPDLVLPRHAESLGDGFSLRELLL